MVYNNYHLFTETGGNSMCCGPSTAVVARGEPKLDKFLNQN
jgi:hypothetical protein